MTSRWLMRDLNPTFTDSALVADTPPAPTLEVAAVRSEIDLLD